MENFIVNNGITIAYYLTIGTFILMGISFILGIATNAKKSLPMLIGIIGLGILVFILYSMADGVIPNKVSASALEGLTNGKMKFISAGVTAAVLLTIGAFIFMLLDMFTGFFR